MCRWGDSHVPAQSLSGAYAPDIVEYEEIVISAEYIA